MSEGAAPLPAIDARDLSRRFGRHRALDGVSLRVPERATFGLLGANGAGKTTFIRIALGLLLPSSGSVRVGGVSPAEDPTTVQRSVGFVMETTRLYPELRVGSLLRFLGAARGLRKGELEAAVERGLERFHLEHVVDRVVGNLSKGYQQRVSLAQAFLHDPALVMVDEPTGGLDPVQRGDVQGLIGSLRGERTVLLCTHDLHEARALTERVAILSHGRLVAEGPTSEVLGGDDGEALALFRGEGKEAS